MVIADVYYDPEIEKWLEVRPIATPDVTWVVLKGSDNEEVTVGGYNLLWSSELQQVMWGRPVEVSSD